MYIIVHIFFVYVYTFGNIYFLYTHIVYVSIKNRQDRLLHKGNSFSIDMSGIHSHNCIYSLIKVVEKVVKSVNCW